MHDDDDQEDYDSDPDERGPDSMPKDNEKRSNETGKMTVENLDSNRSRAKTPTVQKTRAKEIRQNTDEDDDEFARIDDADFAEEVKRTYSP